MNYAQGAASQVGYLFIWPRRAGMGLCQHFCIIINILPSLEPTYLDIWIIKASLLFSHLNVAGF